MDSKQQQHHQTVLHIKRRRLQELEKRAAIQGIDTPPHIVIEIENLRHELSSSQEPILVVRDISADEKRFPGIPRWSWTVLGVILLIAIISIYKLIVVPTTPEQRLALKATEIAQSALSVGSLRNTLTYTNTGYPLTEPFHVVRRSKDFIASARLYIPKTDDGKWNYGFIFWSGGCRIIFSSDRTWSLLCGEPIPTDSGTLPDLAILPGEYNDITLVIQGTSGILIVNKQVLELSMLPDAKRAAGDVSIGWGWGPMTPNTTLQYENFTVRTFVSR